MQEVIPRIAPPRQNRKTAVEFTMRNSLVMDRIIDLEGYQNTVSQIENGSLQIALIAIDVREAFWDDL